MAANQELTDLRIDVWRRGREVDVRVTHLPTGKWATASGSAGEFRPRCEAIRAVRRAVAEGQ